MFKLSKPTLETSNIFKVNSKDTRTVSVNFEHISHFILQLITEFKLSPVGPEKLVSYNKVFFRTVRNILSYGLGKFVGLHVFILNHLKGGCERITSRQRF